MNLYRLKHTLVLCATRSAVKRADYLRKNGIFHHMGRNCMVMFRKIPLYPQLISIGNNVWIASNVTLVTHDVIHQMLNNCVTDYKFQENVGCIQICNNVFVGTNVTILPNVTIGSNVVIAAGSIVNRSLPSSGVYGGCPAKLICSFEDFVQKRKGARTVKVTKSRENLSDKTIMECWEKANTA